jgi:hypothetical protein
MEYASERNAWDLRNPAIYSADDPETIKSSHHNLFEEKIQYLVRLNEIP